MDNSIFNADKTIEQYVTKQPLFLGTAPGLTDTVNIVYTKLWDLYKEMRSLDWSEDEFDYTQCNLDFKTCHPDTSDMMIKTLAWQWEADSVASRSIVSILAPFVTSSELWATIQAVSNNEQVHANCYGLIVRMSFDNPHEVLETILSVKESLNRLETIGAVFSKTYELGHLYALGQVEKNQEIYDQIFLTFAALLMLERIQFVASFAITFTICGAGQFQPIGKAVQKIAQDELEVHSEFDKTVIQYMLETPEGKLAYERTKPQIVQMFNEVVEGECKWVDYLFEDNRQLVGTNADMIKKWVLFNAKEVDSFLKLNTKLDFPKFNPIPSMEKWLNMNKLQAAPQEQDLAAYKVGIIVNDDANSKFDLDF